MASFRFKAGEKINFAAGQFLKIIFDEANPDNKELNKYLSFSCSPEKDYIEVTKRLGESAFAQKLNSLKSRDVIAISGPLGSCVFKEEYKKIGFLIGGIGITPVVSIIEYVVNKKLNSDVCLIYSNRTEEEIAFKKELDSWQRQNKNIHISYIVTQYEPKDKNCIFGTINKDLVEDRVSDLKERVMFIFGPPKMVEAMASILTQELRVGKENIKTESFIGY